MKIKLSALAIITALVASLAVATFNKPQDIVDTAAGSKDFKTLVTAVKAAGLVEALKSKGPFTVFAPTDQAFAKLEKANPGILAELLRPESKAKLAEILKYHVVSGKVMSTEVVKLAEGTKVKTLQGSSITVSLKNGVKVDGAKIIKTDINCTNGVIHVIDTVILPKAGR